MAHLSPETAPQNTPEIKPGLRGALIAAGIGLGTIATGAYVYVQSTVGTDRIGTVDFSNTQVEVNMSEMLAGFATCVGAVMLGTGISAIRSELDRRHTDQ